MKNLALLFLVLFGTLSLTAQKSLAYHVVSPDGKIDLTVEAGAKIQWSVKYGGDEVVAPSAVSMTLDNGEVLGENTKIVSTETSSANTLINTPFYKKSQVRDHYNQITLTFKGDYGLILRAYNDGVAYRFFTKKAGTLTIVSEQANFNFHNDDLAYVPYVRDLRGKEQYIQSYEALYTKAPVSKAFTDSLGFLPILVASVGKKAVVLEADLEDYPGMFVAANGTGGFKGRFAPYPLEFSQGGYNRLTTMVDKRANYIAKVNGTRSFPWRVVVLTDNDADLANSDMVQKLAPPCQITNTGWIRPGKVAWDWWNDWNITHVDFKAGINTETYKYYIDFAAANHLEYIILDEGWSNDFDLMMVSPRIDLQAIIDYGKQKNVGVILWAIWYAVDQKMEAAFSKYAAMGVKGFKIDFMDRDDQVMVASLQEIAKKAAEHQLIIDYHGMFKPAGLQRTYPNVVNFEGVKGMENVKWTPNDDVPEYDVTIPFIRMVAGPMDYTPGAMRNATKANFRPNNSLPMSQGTRCHQLAMYTIFEAPLQMLADNPTAYMKEQECTDYIAKVPTVFDETVALAGEVGKYVAIARKREGIWYVGAMTNWDARELTIDFSFLDPGKYKALIFKDGVNADRDATDYKRETVEVTANDRLAFHMANGGGLAMRVFKYE